MDNQTDLDILDEVSFKDFGELDLIESEEKEADEENKEWFDVTSLTNVTI